MNYIPPIEIIMTDMSTKLENEILHVVKNVGVLVDKEELVKALNFDRGQYKKGWNDAITEMLGVINERRGEIIPTYCACSSEEWARFSGQACILEILRDDAMEKIKD